MKRVLFLFDRVAHYHVEMFQALNVRLASCGIELHLASGEVQSTAVGRVGVQHKVLPTERKYSYTELDFFGWKLRRIPSISDIVSEVDPDIVVCMCHVGNLAHWWLAINCNTKGKKLVAWQCGYEYHPGILKRTLLGQFIPHFDHHLAYHTNAARYAREHGATDEQITVIHNTINEQNILCNSRIEARQQLRKVHPEIAEKRILLFVGALLIEKKIESLIDSLDLLAREDVLLVVVGDGPHAPALKRYAKGRSDVVFAGAVIQGVGAYFDAAEMYLMPGTGGLGLNEAMAHGLPMIAGYADGSADDLVVDGVTGYRLRHGTSTEIADRIRDLLDNPERAQEMGGKGRELITGKLSFQNFVGRVSDALVRLVDAGSRPNA